MSELVRAVGRSLLATTRRDPAAFVAERYRARIAALCENLRMQHEAAGSLDRNVGRRIDRAF